jgi:signal transduction histidine kinase
MMQSAVPRVRLGMQFGPLVDLLCARMTFSDGATVDWLKAWAQHANQREAIGFELTEESGLVFSVFGQEMPDHGFVISFSDITAQQRTAMALRDMNKTLEQRVAARTAELGIALEQAERANESKTRFVAAASHDLLQPLSAAKLFAASMRESDFGAAANEISGKVVSALTSVEEIIEALLDISKLDVGQATFDIQDVSLRQIFASLESELAPLAQAKNLTLRVVDCDAWVVSDPVFLRRILQNLISNAIRYTQVGGVLVGARRAGGAHLRLEVLDTGPGIAEADQTRIFKEFQRLEPSRSGVGGLGLGLAIVDRACRSLGHQLALRSEVGRGSRFSVTVETTSPPQTGARLALVGLDDPMALAGKVLLLVENDTVLANAIELRLESWGAHVISVTSGAAALDLLGEIDLVPDAMVLDYQIEEAMTGLDVYAEVKARYGPVPALMISANRTPELRLACEVLGLPLLTKPLDPKALKALLEEISGPVLMP